MQTGGRAAVGGTNRMSDSRCSSLPDLPLSSLWSLHNLSVTGIFFSPLTRPQQLPFTLLSSHQTEPTSRKAKCSLGRLPGQRRHQNYKSKAALVLRANADSRWLD